VSRDKLYLQHVLDAIGKIERYAAVGHDEFMVARDDSQAASSLCRNSSGVTMVCAAASAPLRPRT
jgi:hypothetical protein